MEYISIRETAEKWGLSSRRGQVLCSTERIPGAFRIGNLWAIPVDAKKQKTSELKAENI